MSIDFSQRPKGMSKREYAASILGGTKNDYNSDGSPKSGGSGGSDIGSIVDQILGATPGFNTPDKTFDEYYSKKMQKEDRKQAEEMFRPYFEQQIADSMEDLNSWAEMDSINYARTLRQGRAKMAKIGAAIGSERTNWEGEVSQDREANKQEKLRQTERQVGSEAMKNAGYSSIYGDRVGTITDTMNAAIEDQVLWYRDQAMSKYNSLANATYKSSPALNYLGQKL